MITTNYTANNQPTFGSFKLHADAKDILKNNYEHYQFNQDNTLIPLSSYKLSIPLLPITLLES